MSTNSTSMITLASVASSERYDWSFYIIFKFYLFPCKMITVCQVLWYSFSTMKKLPILKWILYRIRRLFSIPFCFILSFVLNRWIGPPFWSIANVFLCWESSLTFVFSLLYAAYARIQFYTGVQKEPKHGRLIWEIMSAFCFELRSV